MASQFKNPVQKLTAFLPSEQLSILNRSLPTWLPPTPRGVKHASNLTHDDHSAKWGVVDTLQIVEFVPLWEQVLSMEKFFMRHHHMVTIWQRRNRKFSPDASNAVLPSAILECCSWHCLRDWQHFQLLVALGACEGLVVFMLTSALASVAYLKRWMRERWKRTAILCCFLEVVGNLNGLYPWKNCFCLGSLAHRCECSPLQVQDKRDNYSAGCQKMLYQQIWS